MTWCASELMRNYFMSGYPWANLGYASSRDLWFAQVAALGGIYLIAFCLALANSALYELIASRVRGAPFPRAAVALALAFTAGGHLYGAIRLHALTGEIRRTEGAGGGGPGQHRPEDQEPTTRATYRFHLPASTAPRPTSRTTKERI